MSEIIKLITFYYFSMQNKKITLLFLCFTIAFLAKAQIQVNDATVAPYTPENLISNYFLGEGVEVLNVKYEGAAEAVGYFNNAQSRIGLNRGIVLTNGRVSSAAGGLNPRFGIDAIGKETANNDNKNDPKDVDVNSIIAPAISYNLSKYTITFIPSSDTLRFRYVFASEEYPQYVCETYNDLFGFFISGPGINGPYENNGQNIALIPGTNLPVTINNINLGSSKPNCPPKFTQFYNNNDKSNIEPVYNAFLNVFTAQAVVQPCKTYTIKLIIADIGDANFDSGVFLEAKSFGTGSVQVDRTTEASDNNIIEGCSAGSITFRLPKKATKDTPLKCNLIGTAVNGKDYKLVSSNLFIPKGDSILKVTVDAIEDQLAEGIETVGFDIQRDVCNRDTFWLAIKDNNFGKTPRKIINDTTICKGQAIKLDATATIALPPNPTFSNKDSVTINTVISGSTVAPTTLPILVSNVTPLQFTPNMIESVCVNARHSWIDDLDLYLVAPNGQFIALSTDNGGNGDNMKNTCFSPSANQNITTGNAPFTNTWLPEESFNELLNGANNPVNGYWNLIAIDDQAGINGKILDWSITFKSNYRIDYQWNTNQNISCTNCPTPTINPKTNFSYQVEIKDVYGCKLRDTAVVTLKDSLAAPIPLCSVSTHNSLIFGWVPVAEATGYEISVNGAIWFDLGTDLAYNYSGLSPNSSVTFEIRAKGGLCAAKSSTKTCKTLACTTVTPKISALQNISCFGKKDGKANLLVNSGGTAPFTYTLDNQSNTNGTFDNLSAGKYTVSIADANTCPALIEFQILEPSALTLALTADSVTCATGADAVALAIPAGGTEPYFYKWGNTTTEPINPNLKKGTYAVTVTDDNGCQLADSIRIYEPEPMTIKLTKTDPSCSNTDDGSAKVFVQSGGNAPFSYLWDTNLGLQTSQKVIGLSPGIQRVTVTDFRGCQVSTALFLSAAKKLDIAKITTSPECFGQKTGSIDVNLTGGAAPYSFLWNNGETNSTLENIKGGNYFLTITDKNNCVLLDTTSLNSPDSLAVTKSNITNVKCFGESNGNINLDVAGGNGVYFYYWSNNATTNSITNLKSGNYRVTVSDGNNCIAKDSVNITQPDSIGILTTVKNIDCKIPDSGAITTLVTGGASPYTFLWAGPNNFSSNTPDINNLLSGIYTLSVTDISTCVSTKTINLTTPTNFSVSETISSVKCKGDSTGSIMLNLVGGTPPFDFQWSNNKKTPSINNLLSGNYSVTINDISDCSLVKYYTINEPNTALNLQISAIDSLCNGATNGELEASTVGGTSPYVYKWELGQTTPKVSNLSAGFYTLTVTDWNQCTASAQREINEFGKIDLKIGENVASCFNGNDAILKITEITYNQVVIPINQFTYRWSNGSNLNSADQLETGKTYTVTVTNGKGCSAMESRTTKNPTPVTIQLLSSKNPSCAKGNDGEISVRASGGSLPYTFNWSNKDAGQKIVGLSDGDFSVTASDSKGCTATDSYNLTKPKSFTFNSLGSKIRCAGTSTGTAQINVVGGTPPYAYEWESGEKTANLTNLSAGNYTFTITDAAGCEKTGSVKIDAVAALSATFTASPVRCGNQSNGAFSIFPKGGTAPYQYSVNGKPFNGQSQQIALRANVYDVIVKDANGCQTELSIPILQPDPLRVDLGKDTTLNFGDSYRIPTEISNNVGELKYTWLPDETKIINCSFCKNPIVTPNVSTLYTVTAKDSLGCVASGSINILVKVNTKVFVPTGFSPNGDEENDLLLVHGEKGAIVLDFQIFDRWGAMIYSASNFEVNDPTIGWDGLHRNESVSSGLYPWTLRVQFKDGSSGNFRGAVMLVR